MSDEKKQLSRAAREKRFIVRAGLFVALGMLLAGVVVFLIGKERRFFDKQITYRAAFENLDGLKLDAPVWLGGLEVGRVSAITFSPDLGDKRIQVEMELSSKFSDRVRSDSVARISSRGVLGDKAVDISLGSPEAKKLENGAELETGSSGDLSSLLKAGGEIVDNAVAITRDLRGAVASYTDPEMRKDIAGMVKSLSEILGEVETGNGALHALVYDKKTGQEMRTLVANASASAARLEGAISEVETLLHDVRTGSGAAHALIYDKKIANSFSELGAAAEELSSLINDAKHSKNGAVYQLVYGDSKGMFADLSAAAADVKKITSSVRAGEGTLGGLIRDPTVYEDLRTILGNVKRNRILRELVRYSISNQDEVQSVGKVQEKK